MATMTRTKPAAEIARFPDGHASQVRADTEHNEPFGLLNAIAVRLRISKRFPFHILGVLDFVGGAVADEDGLTAPFDDYLGERDVRRGKSIIKVIGCGLVDGVKGTWAKEISSAHIFAFWNGAEVDLNFGLGKDVGRGGHIDEEICATQ